MGQGKETYDLADSGHAGRIGYQRNPDGSFTELGMIQYVRTENGKTICTIEGVEYENVRILASN